MIFFVKYFLAFYLILSEMFSTRPRNSYENTHYNQSYQVAFISCIKSCFKGPEKTENVEHSSRNVGFNVSIGKTSPTVTSKTTKSSISINLFNDNIVNIEKEDSEHKHVKKEDSDSSSPVPNSMPKQAFSSDRNFNPQRSFSNRSDKSKHRSSSSNNTHNEEQRKSSTKSSDDLFVNDYKDYYYQKSPTQRSRTASQDNITPLNSPLNSPRNPSHSNRNYGYQNPNPNTNH